MIMDGHVHCGAQDFPPPQDYQTIAQMHKACGIAGAEMMAPVMEVYDRHNPDFKDTPEWQARRARANRYLLDLSRKEITPKVYPFFFVWNDFRVDELDSGYVGIKWHRHPDEPEYHYNDPACRKMLRAIHDRGLPIILEEEFHHTLNFVRKLAPDCRILIPHIGHLNGGYEALKEAGIWSLPNIFTDSSGGQPAETIQEYADDFGTERLIFGSDYPFCTPARSLEIIHSVRMRDEDRARVLSKNFLRFIRAPS
jgi:hypothetical protein